MNRFEYIRNQRPERKPFSACEKCGKVWKEDYKCCSDKSIQSKPSDSLPSRSSFKNPNNFNQIWNNAAQEMDNSIEFDEIE